MYVSKESREKLCIEICDFRDMLLKEFDEEVVYSSLLWISSLMFLSSSDNLKNRQNEAIKAIKASYTEEKERRNAEILLKAKGSIEKQKKLKKNICEVLNFLDFKKEINKHN
jgi:predicted rRNA methylase YqxC with S4 and FtsJ domains